VETMTISQVSKDFSISTRMLRYYEQEGLIKSFRREDYAYRMYDEEAISRLSLILLLRRLRIPVKQIKTILQKPDAVIAVDIFRRNIEELDEEITALSTIRDILIQLANDLLRTADVKIQGLLTKDAAIMAAIDALSPASIIFREDKTMDKIQKAEERLSKLSDVRIVYLPPATVAAAHYIGDEPEGHANLLIDQFVREIGLVQTKPDLRHYGFNHPNPVDETGFHGYEIWVTIPDDMDVQPPLVKKQFAGGLYAAHMIPFGNFGDWDLMLEWAMKNDKYEFTGDLGDQEHMCGLLEEHLNYANHAHLDNTEPEDFQLDLLMPIREKAK
jgi:DNA-binding transcriptional MerR regulator